MFIDTRSQRRRRWTSSRFSIKSIRASATVSSGTDQLLNPPTAESLSSAYQPSISIIFAGGVRACKRWVKLTCSSLSTEGRDGALPFPQGASTVHTGLTARSLLKSVILGKNLKNWSTVWVWVLHDTNEKLLLWPCAGMVGPWRVIQIAGVSDMPRPQKAPALIWKRGVPLYDV